MTVANPQTHGNADHDKAGLNVKGQRHRAFGAAHVAGQKVATGVKDRREQNQQGRGLDDPGPGAQHDDDANHADDHGGPASGADLFAQKEDRQKRHDQRADIGHRHGIGQRQGRKADKERHVRHHHDTDAQKMRSGAAGGDLRPTAVRGMDDAQDESHRHHGPDQDHLMQRIATRQELDRHVIDGKDQRPADCEKNTRKGQRPCHRLVMDRHRALRLSCLRQSRSGMAKPHLRIGVQRPKRGQDQHTPA